MQLLNKEPNLNFVGQRKLAARASIVAMLIAIAAIAINGLNFGIDFTGGTLVEVGYDDAADIESVRQTMASNGFPEAVVQHFGSTTDVLVRIAPRAEHFGTMWRKTPRSTGWVLLRVRRVPVAPPRRVRVAGGEWGARRRPR